MKNVKLEEQVSNNEAIRGIIKTLERAKQAFPQIYKHALEIYSQRGIRKYTIKSAKQEIIFWCVTGTRAIYIVVIRGNKFICSCPDFVFHVLLKSNSSRRTFCAHILACMLAIIRNHIINISIELPEDQMKEFLIKWI